MFRGRSASDAIALAIAVIVTASSAWAEDDEKQACMRSYVDAQRARKVEHLLESRRAAMVCARAVCPVSLRQDCVTWLRDVEAVTPSVVVAVVDEAGRDRNDAKVLVDGRDVTPDLAGGALPLDPGTHTMVVALPDHRRLEHSIVLREGERGRRISFSFAKEAAPAAPLADTETSRPVPAPAIGLAVVSGAAFLAAGALGAWGLAEKADACHPGCSPSDADAIAVKFHAADVALGVGVVTIGVAAILYFTRPSVPSRSERTVQSWPGAPLFTF